jgi:DNA replicative helicase MCM subunit Mcm2 (Cdc46/Mcm family)
MNHNPKRHSVRRIVLPSGKSIEVVRFHEVEETVKRGLHECPECVSELVQPVDWAEAPNGRWVLTLQCPNCGWFTDGVFDSQQVHELEDKLDDGLADMLRDLRHMTQANMSEEIERFTTALRADMILPEDF